MRGHDGDDPRKGRRQAADREGSRGANPGRKGKLQANKSAELDAQRGFTATATPEDETKMAAALAGHHIGDQTCTPVKDVWSGDSEGTPADLPDARRTTGSSRRRSGSSTATIGSPRARPRSTSSRSARRRRRSSSSTDGTDVYSVRVHGLTGWIETVDGEVKDVDEFMHHDVTGTHEVRDEVLRGFTLIEVMLALAILAMGLAVLIKDTANNIASTEGAHMEGVVTDLARGQMDEIEEKLEQGRLPGHPRSQGRQLRRQGWESVTWSTRSSRSRCPISARCRRWRKEMKQKRSPPAAMRPAAARHRRRIGSARRIRTA